MIEKDQNKNNNQNKFLLDLCRGFMKQKSLCSFSSWPDDYIVKVVTIVVDSSVIPSPQEHPSLEQLGPPLIIKYLPYWQCICFYDK